MFNCWVCNVRSQSNLAMTKKSKELSQVRDRKYTVNMRYVSLKNQPTKLYVGNRFRDGDFFANHVTYSPIFFQFSSDLGIESFSVLMCFPALPNLV